MTTRADAASDAASPQSDTAIVTTPDTGIVTTPDTAIVTTPDTAIVTTPDTAIVTTPDTGIVTTPDTAIVTTPDTGIVTMPDTAIVTTPDTAIVTTPDTGPLPKDAGAVDPFAGRSFTLDNMHPAPTPDPTCNKVQPAEYFILDFGPTIQTLTIRWVQGSAMFKFSAKPGPEANKLTFHLDSSPGGILTMERDQGVYVGQITMYGSGVPVITCLRAALSPQP